MDCNMLVFVSNEAERLSKEKYVEKPLRKLIAFKRTNIYINNNLL